MCAGENRSWCFYMGQVQADTLLEPPRLTTKAHSDGLRAWAVHHAVHITSARTCITSSSIGW